MCGLAGFHAFLKNDMMLPCLPPAFAGFLLAAALLGALLGALLLSEFAAGCGLLGGAALTEDWWSVRNSSTY